MNNENLGETKLLSEKPLWDNNPNTIWLGSTISISRNIEKFNFPEKLTVEKRQQVISVISAALLKSMYLEKAKLIAAETIPTIQKEFLVEHFLSSQGFEPMHSGEAFILDHSNAFLATINLKDHLSIHAIDITQEIEKTWDRLAKIEMEMEQSLKFAFSSNFGFLTSDPAECGTALVIRLFLHLPVLLYSGRLNTIIEMCKKENVSYAGIQGSPTDFIGDIMAFRNTHTLGVTEETILSSLRTLATKLLVEEKSMRMHIQNENESELAAIKDKVSRAYAILMHSYQIEEIEALEALSLLKLGLDLEWLQGIKHTDINALFFSCRRAHSLCYSSQNKSSHLLSHQRAEYIHRALGGLQLLI